MKLAVADAATVTVTVVLAVKLPDVPWMVTVAKPAAAVALAASVSVLVPVAGFGEKVAVTPLGRPVALSVTLPVKPSAPVTVMVVVPLEPWVTFKVADDEDSVKLGDAVPVSALMKFCPLGLPHPVTRS